ncbi:MAG: hypothetical protein ACM34B_11330 [Nitrospira sp.]
MASAIGNRPSISVHFVYRCSDFGAITSPDRGERHRQANERQPDTVADPLQYLTTVCPAGLHHTLRRVQ